MWRCACLEELFMSAAILALMTTLGTLAKLVNCGYLFGAMMVASSVLLRRYLPKSNAARPAQRAAVLVRYWLVVSFSIGKLSTATYDLAPRWQEDRSCTKASCAGMYCLACPSWHVLIRFCLSSCITHW